MLWLMNTFNKSSSYLIQVLTVIPSVLPSSTIFSVWCENGGKDHFSAAKMGMAKIAVRSARHFVPSTPLNLKSWICPCNDSSNREQFVVCLGWVHSASLSVNKDLIGLYQVDDIIAATPFFLIERCFALFKH